MDVTSPQYKKKIEREIKNMKVAIEVVTPEQADKYLQSNTMNRKLSLPKVRKWINALKKEEWTLNGETIKFDKKGVLIDGQHRFKAISESGIPAPMVIIRGLETEAFHTIDIGKARTTADILASNDVVGPNWVAGALIWVDKLRSLKYMSTAGSDRLNQTNILDFYLTHKKIEKYGPVARSIGRTKISTAPVLMALFYLFDKKDQRLGSQFRNGMEEDFNVGSLFYKMKQKLKRLASNQKGMNYWETRRRIGIMVKCWNAYRENKDKNLKDIEYRWETEDFPSIN